MGELQQREVEVVFVVFVVEDDEDDGDEKKTACQDKHDGDCDGHKHENKDNVINFVLSDVARLDTCVTVVDAVNFYSDLDSVQTLKEKYGEKEVEDEDDRSIARLLIDQIEFSNVILLNKCDLMPEDKLNQIEAMIKRLNPEARLVRTVKSAVPLEHILNTNLFSFDKAATSAGWLKEIRGEHVPETVEYGISSFVYKRRKPFHTEKLYKLLMEDKAFTTNTGVKRSKGFTWLCTRPDDCGEWEQTGSIITLSSGGKFFGAMGAEVWDTLDEEVTASIKADCEGEYMDRRQEIVIIGQDLDREKVEKMLDECLVDDELFSLGPIAWTSGHIEDKWEDWEDDDEEEDDEEEDDDEEDDDEEEGDDDEEDEDSDEE